MLRQLTNLPRWQMPGAFSRDHAASRRDAGWRRTDKLNISKQILLCVGCVLPSFWNQGVNVVSLPKGDRIRIRIHWAITGLVENMDVNIIILPIPMSGGWATNSCGMQNQCAFQDLSPCEDVDNGWDLHPPLDSMPIVPVERDVTSSRKAA